MARNMITGKETQKIQEYTQEQIDRAEHMEIEIPADVKEQIFEYANLISEEEKVRTLVRNLTDAINQADEDKVEELLDDAKMDIQDLPDPTIGKLELRDYGYTAEDMVPLRKEAALDYHRMGSKIYCLGSDGDKGEYHFKGKIDIGTGNGGLLSQLKLQNEMRLTDESWINYQRGKGNEEFQKYMEDLTDMQNHVLPYLQSFCNLEEQGVKERREQQIAERNEGRADERVTSTEANAVVKDAGKTDRKTAQQKQTVDGKDKKLSIHERLEINKKIIQEKQGKDKPERGADFGVR